MQDVQIGLDQELIEAQTGKVAAHPSLLPNLEEAYAIQRRVASHSNLPVMVWKLGLTSERARNAYDSAEPVIGRLSASAIFSDNSKINFIAPEMYAEAELVFEIGHDLPDKNGPYTRADICAVVTGLYAGIEVVRSRFASDDLPLSLLVADNVMGHGLVWGRKLSDGWDDRFAEMPVTLTRNEAEPVEGSTALVMGNPLDAVVWLANFLRDREGTTLMREQMIASGTCTGATPIEPNDRIEVAFDGEIAVRMAVNELNQQEKR